LRFISGCENKKQEQNFDSTQFCFHSVNKSIKKISRRSVWSLSFIYNYFTNCLSNPLSYKI